MMFELVDSTAAKIMLATRPGDSLERVARKIGLSSTVVSDRIERLEEAGMLRHDDGLYIEDEIIRDRYRALVAGLCKSGSPSLSEGYIIPHFAGMPFAYTKPDAVYVWTRGNYQLNRDSEDYPVFLQVLDRDVDSWKDFFDEFGVSSGVEKRPDDRTPDTPLSYIIFPKRGEISRDWVDGRPVIPLDRTVEHINQYREDYGPVLDIIADEFNLNTEDV